MQDTKSPKINNALFENKDITELNTWPFGPEGSVITKPLKLLDTNILIDDFEEMEEKERVQINNLVERFSDKQREVISWILAAVIGVLGNLSINLAFGQANGGNAYLAFSVLLIILFLVAAFLFFLPKISAKFWYEVPGVNFPSGFEETIEASKVSDPESKLMLSNKERFELMMVEYEGIIRAAIFRKHFNKVLNFKTLKISRLVTVNRDKGVYNIEVQTKGLLNWFNPNGRDNFYKELNQLELALKTSRFLTMLYLFEIDEETWKTKGPQFVDFVSGINLEGIQGELLSKFNPKYLLDVP